MVFLFDILRFSHAQVGAENHIRVSVSGVCQTANAIFDRCQEVLSVLEQAEGCTFARSPTYGFITSSPLDIGTGMRAVAYPQVTATGAELTQRVEQATTLGLACAPRPDGPVEMTPIRGLMITEGEIVGRGRE